MLVSLIIGIRETQKSGWQKSPTCKYPVDSTSFNEESFQIQPLPTPNLTLSEVGMKESSRKVSIGKPQRIFVSSDRLEKEYNKKR